MKICIAGKNNIAVDSLEYLIKEHITEIENLVVVPSECVLSYDSWQKSLIKVANKYNIPCIELENLYDIEDLCFLSMQYDKIIKPEKFKSKKLFNIHFALLPKYKGMYTSVLPLLNGEKISGVTIHEIDKKIDTGNIISQKKFEIDIQDTSRDLYFKYMKYGFELFTETIIQLLTGRYVTKVQSYIDATINYGRDLNFNKINIDLKRTSFEIHNNLRAYIFKEYQLPEINGYRINKSILTDKKKKEFIFEPNENYIEITGIDGYVINAYYEK